MSNENLYIADTPIGELIWGPDGDFPWAKGRFIPVDGFALFQQYIESETNPDGTPIYKLDVLALEAAGYKSTDLKIIDDNDMSYLVALHYYDDGTAYWRFSMSPFDEDE